MIEYDTVRLHSTNGMLAPVDFEHGRRRPGAKSIRPIWGRTVAGRGLIVAIRPLAQWNSQIIGARAMTAAEDELHQAWEATRDDQ